MGIRTPDIQLAKLALYQLSYTPVTASGYRLDPAVSFLTAIPKRLSGCRAFRCFFESKKTESRAAVLSERGLC